MKKDTDKPQGLYANIHAKRKRIEAGSGEKMRPVGAKGAPTAKAFKASAKTAKKPAKKTPVKKATGGTVTYVKKKDGNRPVKIS
jgi:hypothetical protein